MKHNINIKQAIGVLLQCNPKSYKQRIRLGLHAVMFKHPKYTVHVHFEPDEVSVYVLDGLETVYLKYPATAEELMTYIEEIVQVIKEDI